MEFMAGTDYEKWAKYDPNAQLSLADLQEEKEDRERERRKARKELKEFEGKVLLLTLDFASAATSRAKVERLRAMKKQRGGRRRNNKETKKQQELKTGNVEKTINEPVDATRGRDLQNAIECRDKALQILGGNMISDDLQVYEYFQRSASAAESLLSSLPSLPSSVRFIPVPQKSTSCGCGRGHEQPTECVVEEEALEEEASPRLANIALVGVRVLNDARVGLSRCLLNTSPTEVVDHLKRVLLSDDSRADAWMLRGKAFQIMNVPLLAQLHYKRATEEYDNVRNPYSEEMNEVQEEDIVTVKENINIKASSWNPKILLNECRRIILNGRKPRMERLCHLLLNVLTNDNDGTNIQQSEIRLKRLIQEAHVIYEEGYYDTAALRYEAGARAARKMMAQYLADCQNDATPSSSLESTRTNQLSMTTLRELAIECHVHVANCCLERQLGYKRANMHCTYALRLDPTNATVLYTRAKALMEDMRLTLALEDLSRANVLCKQNLIKNGKSENTSKLMSDVRSLMVQILHRCETWMENSDYISFTKSLEKAKIPNHSPMSIVLILTKTTNPFVALSSAATSSSLFTCNTTSDDMHSNFMSIMTGVHSLKLGSLSKMYDSSNGIKVPTLGHYLQDGVGVGSHDTAFCGKWYGNETDPTVQHGFGARLWTENNVESITTEAALWIEKKVVEESSIKKPFFIVVSLDGEDDSGSSNDTTNLAISKILDVATKATCGREIVFATTSISSSSATFLSFMTLSSSASFTSSTTVTTTKTSIDNDTFDVSILDILPTLLHCGGVIKNKNDVLENFCSTIAGYAGFYNPLPFYGYNLFYMCIQFESKRRFMESQYVYTDHSINAATKTGATTACMAPSSLMSVLKGERRGPISFCIDPSCLHETNGGIAGVDVIGKQLHPDGGNILRRYFSTSVNEENEIIEIVKFSSDEYILLNNNAADYNTTTSTDTTTTNNNNNNNNDNNHQVEPLSLRSTYRMKFIMKTIDQVETIQLYNVTDDQNETNDLSSNSKYNCLVEIGKRMLIESRDRSK
jgi:tetratricopeptide (TPR) repeat protein